MATSILIPLTLLQLEKNYLHLQQVKKSLMCHVKLKKSHLGI